MKNFSIRMACPSDAPIIQSILNESEIMWTNAMILDSLQSLDLSWVLCKGEQVVGVLIVRVLDSDLWEILQIAVSKTHRQQGGAKRLLSHLTSEARENNVMEMQLEVRQSNQVAIELYQQFSFKQIGLRKAYYSDGENALLFSLSVPH